MCLQAHAKERLQELLALNDMLPARSVRTATAVPGRKVKVKTAIVFIAALSCRVSWATCAVAAAISRFSRLSRLDSSAILRLLSANCIFSLLSRCMMKFEI